MGTSRRSVISGIGAGALVTGAQGCAGRRETREAEAQQAPGPFSAAANYSAESNGVSMLVMRGGDILFEDYPGDGSVDRGWQLASGTKSFTGVMAAAAQADGLLDIDEPVQDAIYRWRANPGLRTITTRHLLTLTSGIRIAGPTARPPNYDEAARDAEADHPPGEVFAYGPEPFQIFGAVLSEKLRGAGLDLSPVHWFRSRVLGPMGVSYTDWGDGLRPGNDMRLAQGAEFTARAWATFGQWVMDGAAGVDRDVYRALFEGTAANPGYGLSWWLIRPGLVGPGERAGISEASFGEDLFAEDIVMAAGAGNQRLYLLRRRGLVVVRQADGVMEGLLRRRRVEWSDAEFLRRVLAGV